MNVTLLNRNYTSPPNTLPYETLPGGNTNLSYQQDLIDNYSNNFIGFWRWANNTSLYNGDICFAPTYSALDVETVTPTTAFAKYVNNSSDNPSPPRVPRYLAQEARGTVFNLPHLLFTARNSEWILNEMQGASNAQFCSNECAPFSITTEPSSGSVCVGTGATFRANNVPPNATVSWTAQGGTVQAGTGLTFVTFPDGMSDRIVVQATVQTVEGCTLTRGATVLSGPPVQSPNPICGYYSSAGNGNSFSIPPVPGATAYRWTEHNSDLAATLPPVTTPFPQYNIRSVSFPFNVGVTITLTVEPLNDCGIALPTVGTLTLDSDGYGYLCSPTGRFGAPMPQPVVVLYPNPAREFVRVEVENADPRQVLTARLYDGQGLLRVENSRSGNKPLTLRLKEASLPAGLYLVHVLQGARVLSRQPLLIE